MINKLSSEIADKSGVSEKIEVTIPGTALGPWTVITIGDGESYWFYGGPKGYFVPDGSIIQGWGKIWILNKFNLKTFDSGDNF